MFQQSFSPLGARAELSRDVDPYLYCTCPASFNEQNGLPRGPTSVRPLINLAAVILSPLLTVTGIRNGEREFRSTKL